MTLKDIILKNLPFFNRAQNAPNPKINYRVGVDCPRETIIIPTLASGITTIELGKHAVPDLNLQLELTANIDGTGAQIDASTWARGDSPDQEFYKVVMVVPPDVIAANEGQTYYAAYNTTGQFPGGEYLDALGDMAVDHEDRLTAAEAAIEAGGSIANLADLEDVDDTPGTTGQVLTKQGDGTAKWANPVGGGSGGVDPDLTLSPLDGATGVLKGVSPTVTANKWFWDTVTGYAKYYTSAADRTNDTNAIAGTLTRTSNILLTFNPDSDFAYEGLIYGRIPAGIKFADGSTLANNIDFSFTIEVAPADPAPSPEPVITAVAQANGDILITVTNSPEDPGDTITAAVLIDGLEFATPSLATLQGGYTADTNFASGSTGHTAQVILYDTHGNEVESNIVTGIDIPVNNAPTVNIGAASAVSGTGFTANGTVVNADGPNVDEVKISYGASALSDPNNGTIATRTGKNIANGGAILEVISAVLAAGDYKYWLAAKDPQGGWGAWSAAQAFSVTTTLSAMIDPSWESNAFDTNGLTGWKATPSAGGTAAFATSPTPEHGARFGKLIALGTANASTFNQSMTANLDDLAHWGISLRFIDAECANVVNYDSANIRVQINFIPRDSGGANIIDSATHGGYVGVFFIYGGGAAGSLAGADYSLRASSNFADIKDTWIAKTKDIKAYLTSKLLAGKTWANVAKVDILINVYSNQAGQTIAVGFDNGK